MTLPRRAVLAGLTGVAALTLLPRPLAAVEAAPDVEEAIAAILRGREPVEGGLVLEMPDVAENGAQVPLTVRADSPMTPEDHVTAIHLIATRNPTPGLGRGRLTPGMGRAEFTFRVRLAEDQEVLAFAETIDGRVLAAAARVAVSVGGCAT